MYPLPIFACSFLLNWDALFNTGQGNVIIVSYRRLALRVFLVRSSGTETTQNMKK